MLTIVTVNVLDIEHGSSVFSYMEIYERSLVMDKLYKLRMSGMAEALENQLMVSAL